MLVQSLFDVGLCVFYSMCFLACASCAAPMTCFMNCFLQSWHAVCVAEGARMQCMCPFGGGGCGPFSQKASRLGPISVALLRCGPVVKRAMDGFACPS